MRFGCCTAFQGTDDDLARIETLAGLGYHYVELPVGCLHVEGDPEAFYAVRRALNRAALAPEALNCLLPGDLKVVGDEVDWPRVERYVALSLDRAEEVGARVVVFGSGAARRIPEGYPTDDALHQVRYFLGICADYAGSLVVSVEPLSATQTNTLNLLSDVSLMVREIGRPEVRVTPDSVHMDHAGESWDEITAAADLLAHVHIGDRGGAVPGTAEADLPGFLETLARAGYDSRISVECRLDDFATDAAAAIQYLQEHTSGKR
jgi:sugar phosphate isomerase/epimerase